MEKGKDKIAGRIKLRRGNGGAADLQRINIRLTEDQARRWNPARETEFIAEETPEGLLLRPLSPPLTKVYVEPTSRCNLACKTCMRKSWDEQPGEMAAETYERFLRGLRGISTVHTVAFWGFGEPLLHPNILGMIGAASRQGYETELITNGLLLNAEISAGLVEAGLDRLVVSLDGTTPETYSKVRDGASFETVMSNMEGLRRAKAARHGRKPSIGVEFVLMKSNLADLEGLMPVARRMEADLIVLTNVLPYSDEMKDEIIYWLAASGIYPSPRTKWNPEIRLPRFDARPETMKHLGEIIRHRNSGGHPPEWGPQPEGSCPFVRRGEAAVSWDGKVSPCIALMHSYKCYVLGREKEIRRYTVGDIATETMDVIWKRDEYRSFRERVIEFDFSPCVGCGGCELSEKNDEDCVGNPFPTCGDCLWAKGVILCP